MNDYRELVLKLYDMLEPFNSQGLELKEDTELVADLGLDSLKVMQLIVTIEDTFDISIPLNILPNVRTVKDFAEQLQQLLSEGA